MKRERGKEKKREAEGWRRSKRQRITNQPINSLAMISGWSRSPMVRPLFSGGADMLYWPGPGTFSTFAGGGERESGAVEIYR